ncbi:MAG TPA: putative porin [Pyrinomonadaceae bacterium]|nr:putative porin [Pyrinomonadaceae bacterium]
MLMKPGPETRRNRVALSILALVLLGANVHSASAQGVAAQSTSRDALALTGELAKTGAESGAANKKPETVEEKLNALEQILERQNQRLDQMQQTIAAQQETIRLLAGRLNPGEMPATISATQAMQAKASQPQPIEDRLKKVETRVSEIGAIKVSGDLRLRSESFFGLTNNLATGNSPTALGNELSSRHRMRLRGRLALTGTVGDEFDWGLRIATGSFADNISTNQTLTDFFNRKPIALDQAFITYKPRGVPGLRLQGGKFETPWTYKLEAPWAYPELVTDTDLMVEGFNESYTRTFKKSSVKELKFIAWQLPFLERNSAFVRNSNGTVNIEQSRRGGRDLALFGGQVRARLEPNAKVALTLSVADLYFSGTQFISPVQVFGSQLQLPITITIPASGTTPAQTVTTQVSIARDQLVAGNANLGLTNASNNAINRDGRLASGFNLVDMFARLELKHSRRWPVAVVLNFVTNTQTHGVVTAGPGGADLIIPNHENNGFWGEVQVGQTKARGDLAFGYTFMRIEKDAVLTPFNMSDITQQSDMRGHKFQFAYAADPRVTFAITGIVTERPTDLLGAFSATPPGSLNRPTKRLQFDTILKF